MQFRTSIKIKQESNISYQNKIMLFGSCFSEHIGNKLSYLKFNALCNPLGILYNPMSIANTIHRIIDKKEFRRDDIFEQDGIWNSFCLHSKFAKISANDFLENANQQLTLSHQFIQQTDVVFITLGTAWIYELVTTGEVAANCHKIPSSQFNRRRIDTEEAVSTLSAVCRELLSINPKMRIIFTVSPIRHWKDGAHENQISKATLLLAIDEVQKKSKQIDYFPAYEIILDELRDYRFYAEDMIHPNEIAIQYVWEKFEEMYFTEETKQQTQEIEKLKNELSHRPFNPESKTYLQFREKTYQHLCLLKEKYPYIDFKEDEIRFQ